MPMLKLRLSFWHILKNFPGNDLRKAISFAGVFLLLAALTTMMIKSKK